MVPDAITREQFRSYIRGSVAAFLLVLVVAGLSLYQSNRHSVQNDQLLHKASIASCERTNAFRRDYNVETAAFQHSTNIQAGLFIEHNSATQRWLLTVLPTLPRGSKPQVEGYKLAEHYERINRDYPRIPPFAPVKVVDCKSKFKEPSD